MNADANTPAVPGAAVATAGAALSECEDPLTWENFCLASAEGSPFMLPWFTRVVAPDARRFFWTEAGTPLAAVLVPVDVDGKIKRPPFSVYYSLCYSATLDSGSTSGHLSKRLSVLENIVAALARRFPDRVSFAFHPRIIDVRPLLWHNHDAPAQGTFNVLVRYTAVSELSDAQDATGLLRQIRKSRKEDYKKALKAGLTMSVGATVEEVLDLYGRTFERQGIDVPEDTRTILRRILAALTEERGFVMAARTGDGVAVAAAVVLLDARSAYSLVIASRPDFRHSGANTACMVEALLESRRRGRNRFDFVGANSPNRGDYKLSFKGALQCYYEAELPVIGR